MTDQEKAADLRARLRQTLDPVIEVLREAAADGYQIEFNLGGTPVDVTKIDISKLTKL